MCVGGTRNNYRPLFCTPALQKQHGEAFDALVGGLRYGNVTINAPATMGYVFTALPWGGAPGESVLPHAS